MDAIKLAIEAQEANKDKTCYLLGGIVHNEDTLAVFKERGFIILDEKKAPLAELIETIEDGQVVVFSAHGHARSLDRAAERKHLIVYDATCPFVTANMRMAEHAKDRDVIHVGVKGHMEAEAFLQNEAVSGFFDTKAGHLETYKDDIKDPLIIGQTTLSKKEFDDAYEAILGVYENAEAGLSRCRSTTARQDALKEAAKEADCIIVLGSKTSNNSQKLFEIGLESGVETHLLLGLDELRLLPLKNKRRIALCSGASTSPKTFDACLEYIRSL